MCFFFLFFFLVCALASTFGCGILYFIHIFVVFLQGGVVFLQRECVVFLQGGGWVGCSCRGSVWYSCKGGDVLAGGVCGILARGGGDVLAVGGFCIISRGGFGSLNKSYSNSGRIWYTLKVRRVLTRQY
jgi:hypothetical protein